MLQKYDELFRGTLKDIMVRLVVDEKAIPKFHKPRPVPYVIRGAIERDLERLASLGVLKKITHIEWAALVVPVPKTRLDTCIPTSVVTSGIPALFSH